MITIDVVNKNLKPDELGFYLVTLCAFNDIANCPNTTDWIDEINNGERSVFGDYAVDSPEYRNSINPFRILKVKVGTDIDKTFLYAVISTVGLHGIRIGNLLEGDKGVKFIPRFQNNDPKQKIITFDFTEAV